MKVTVNSIDVPKLVAAFFCMAFMYDGWIGHATGFVILLALCKWEVRFGND